MEWLTEIWRDLVLAGRLLAKSRAFTFVCVVSLGIGMAPPIAIQYGSRIFTTPPPGLDTAHPTPLVQVFTTPVGPREIASEWSYPDFVDLRGGGTGVEMAGWATGPGELVLPDSGGQKTPTYAMFVSPNYFQVIGMALTRGPGLGDTVEPVVVVAHWFWQKRLAADPDIVGKTLDLNGVPHTVVGIGPEQFSGHMAAQDVELFLPLDRHPGVLADQKARFDRSKAWVRIHGRLSSGVSVEQASAAVSALTAQLAKEYPATNEFIAGAVAPYHPLGHESTEATFVLRLFRIMTAIPLIVVCLNVSGMVQVRSAMRERELSIRQAIGATRGRLMRHLLAEAVVLAAAGGTLASLVLFNIAPVAAWWSGESLPPQVTAALRVDLSMLAACAGLCLATSLICGWLPALRFSRPVIMTVLKDESGIGGIRAGRVHRVTSALQIAIAVPLLVMSTMSLDRVRSTATSHLGFEADLLYAAPIEIANAGAEDSAFQMRRLRDDLAQASGVAAVTLADGLPLDFRYRLTRVSTPPAADVAPTMVTAHVTRVGDGFLDTLGIPLLRGRAFAVDDGPGAALVAIVSKSLADRLFPGADAIGQPLTFESPGDQDKQPRTMTIIGVTADFPTSQMSTDREQVLLPLAQHPDILGDSVNVNDDRGGTAKLMLVARSTPGEPAAKLTAALENTIREHDREFDRGGIVTGTGLRQHSMDDFLTQSAVAATGGGVALLLAALGIYGVVGLMVATRTREIAVRVTLGASRPRVIAMILFDVVKLVAPGVGVGLLIAVAFVRLNGGVLGIALSATEPLAYVVGAAIAVLAAILAGLAPARRAASIQPMVAMRST